MRGTMGKYEEITKARQVLELHEFASLKEIKNKYRELLREWHPDLCRENEAIRKQKTIEIIKAYRIIMDYCEQYRFSFSNTLSEFHGLARGYLQRIILHR
jgi:DnaJ-class molecular chaperone